MHDPYDDQLKAARYKAERDQARQELARLMSAYDLLHEEDREALRWVRDNGGLDEVGHTEVRVPIAGEGDEDGD